MGIAFVFAQTCLLVSVCFTHGAQFLRSGLTLKEMSCNGKRLWSPPTAQELQALWGKDGGDAPDAPGRLADPPTPWTVMEDFSEKDYLQCLFQKPDEVGWASGWLFGTGSFGDELFEVPHGNDLQRSAMDEKLRTANKTMSWMSWQDVNDQASYFFFDSHY